MTVVSRARSGMAESSAAIGPIELGAGRLAPLGVPVVPEVRMTARPATAGGGSGVSTRVAMSCASDVSSPPSAVKQTRPGRACATMAANSRS